MSKRARTLLRVSSRQQLHDDDIPIQRAEAEQFIAKHSDWVFDKEYLEKEYQPTTMEWRTEQYFKKSCRMQNKESLKFSLLICQIE